MTIKSAAERSFFFVRLSSYPGLAHLQLVTGLYFFSRCPDGGVTGLKHSGVSVVPAGVKLSPDRRRLSGFTVFGSEGWGPLKRVTS